MQECFFTAKDYNYVINWPYIKDQLEKTKNKKLIFWAPDEVDTWQSIKQNKSDIETLCKKTNNKIEFWEGNYINFTQPFSEFINVVNWSNFCTTLVMGKYNVLEQHAKVCTQKKLFISLNRSSMPHKCMFIDKLSKYDLIKDNFVSWHKQNNFEYDFKYFDNQQLIVDNIDINNGNKIFNYVDCYNDAMLDLVCESFDNIPDISEKTYKAIAAKKLFISVGYKGFYKKLKELNFQLYDEIFDYSFDNLDLYEQRVEAVIQQVRKLNIEDLSKITNKLQNKIDNNYSNLVKLSNQVPDEIHNIIDNHSHNVSYYRDVFDYIKKNRHHHNIIV